MLAVWYTVSLVTVNECCRTARGDSSGTALSFVMVKEMPRLEAVKQTLSKDCCKCSLLPQTDLLFMSYFWLAVSPRKNRQG